MKLKNILWVVVPVIIFLAVGILPLTFITDLSLGDIFSSEVFLFPIICALVLQAILLVVFALIPKINVNIEYIICALASIVTFDIAFFIQPEMHWATEAIKSAPYALNVSGLIIPFFALICALLTVTAFLVKIVLTLLEREK